MNRELGRYLVSRVGQAVAVLWAVYTLTFAILYLLPSDPVSLLLAAGNVQVDEVSPAQLAQLKAQYGLDQSLWHQYLDNLWHFVRLDLGDSISLNLPVHELLGQRLPSTLALSVTAMFLALTLGSGLAYLAAYVRWRPARVFLSRLPAVGVSLPPFFVGLLLIQVFSFSLGWFPATGSDGFATLVLPAVMMSIPAGAMLAQVLTRSLNDALAQPYVTTARAKGLTRGQVQARHALRNAALPVLTLLGLLVGQTITDAIVAEAVFTREGMGELTQAAVLAQDVPLVQAIVVVAASGFVLINLLIDLVYPLIDPRVTTVARVA